MMLLALLCIVLGIFLGAWLLGDPRAILAEIGAER